MAAVGGKRKGDLWLREHLVTAMMPCIRDWQAWETKAGHQSGRPQGRRSTLLVNERLSAARANPEAQLARNAVAIDLDW